MNKTIKAAAKVTGRFSGLKTIDSRTGKLARNFPEYKNLILDNGVDYVMAGSMTGSASASRGFNNVLTELTVGTGTTAPTASDTDLQSQVGGYYGRVGNISEVRRFEGGEWINRVSALFRIPAGSVDGVPLTEMGIYYAESSGSIWSRALIRDELGDPISITLLDYEILEVTYEVDFYLPSGASGTVEIEGEVYDYNLVPHIPSSDGFGYWGGAYGFMYCPDVATSSATGVLAIDNPPGKNDDYDLTSQASYTAGTFERFFPGTTLGISEANYTNGIRRLIYCGGFNPGNLTKFCLYLAKQSDGTGIPKTSDHTMNLPSNLVKLVITRP